MVIGRSGGVQNAEGKDSATLTSPLKGKARKIQLFLSYFCVKAVGFKLIIQKNRNVLYLCTVENRKEQKGTTHQSCFIIINKFI